MKTLCRIYLFIFLVLPGAAFALDTSLPFAHQASPDAYTRLVENDHVRVLVMELAPGQIDEWHRHPDETVYFEKGGTLKIHLPDGSAVVNQVPDGGIMWHKAWVHRVENVGDSRVRAIIVEDITSENLNSEK